MVFIFESLKKKSKLRERNMKNSKWFSLMIIASLSDMYLI
jgi:hypothetical protein